jgi:tetratricopeptide (TPR) repeat protein
MKSFIRAALAFLPLLFSSGCAFIYSLDGNLDKQVDTWMAQHEYAKVLDTLQYIRPSNPKYKLLLRKRQQAVEESRRFEQAQITKALNQIEKGQWHEADLTLNNAMEKLPDSRSLRKTYQEFLKQRAQYLKSLNTQLAINMAEQLVKDKPIHQQLQHTLPDDRQTRKALEDYHAQSQSIRQQLLACGTDALRVADLELAEQCYQLADKLQPSATIKDKLANIQKKLASKQMPATQQKQAEPSLSQLGQSLLAKSKKALEGGHLKLALSHYDKIPSSDRNLTAVKSFGQEMHHRIRDNVNQGIELGRKLYSQGQVEQALAVWNKLRELDPDNENLLSHIDRAERVLEKIRKLRKEQKPESQAIPAPE